MGGLRTNSLIRFTYKLNLCVANGFFSLQNQWRTSHLYWVFHRGHGLLLSLPNDFKLRCVQISDQLQSFHLQSHDKVSPGDLHLKPQWLLLVGIYTYIYIYIYRPLDYSWAYHTKHHVKPPRLAGGGDGRSDRLPWRSCCSSLLHAGSIVQFQRTDLRRWGVRERPNQQCEYRAEVSDASWVCDATMCPESALLPSSKALSCISCDFLVGASEGDKMTKHLIANWDHVCRVVEQKGIQRTWTSSHIHSHFYHFVQCISTKSISVMEMCVSFFLVAAPESGVM